MEMCKGHWIGVTVARKCDCSQGGVTDIRKVCYLIERCDSHGGNVVIMFGEV